MEVKPKQITTRVKMDYRHQKLRIMRKTEMYTLFDLKWNENTWKIQSSILYRITEL